MTFKAVKQNKKQEKSLEFDPSLDVRVKKQIQNTLFCQLLCLATHSQSDSWMEQKVTGKKKKTNASNRFVRLSKCHSSC